MEAAKLLVAEGHQVLLHGRNASKLARVEAELSAMVDGGAVESFVADLSVLAEVGALATAVAAEGRQLDVLVNNAGVYGIADPVTRDGLDARFAVNTIAPYLLTLRLLPSMGSAGRVINLSSAAQSPVRLEALAGKVGLSDAAAYAQSKLALTMWSFRLAQTVADRGPAVIALNPGSMLGTKMVQQAYGVPGASVSKGARVVMQAAVAEAFAGVSGRYFDNDSGRFAEPHPDALDPVKSQAVVDCIEAVLAKGAVD